jgi:hypothetical protein
MSNVVQKNTGDIGIEAGKVIDWKAQLVLS